MKKIFKIYVRMSINKKVFYVSDGYILIENDLFEGYLTDNYIEGNYKNQNIYCKLFMYEYNKGEFYLSEFKDKIDYLEIPGKYDIQCINTQAIFHLDIREIIKNPLDIQKIENNLKEIKNFYLDS
ncbi:MAG: hypothetical protein HFJ40_05020 [Clostridia bacterium]|nr:hypothetical protein [Clostridia bacterium]